MDNRFLRYIYDMYSQEKVYPILSIDFLCFLVTFLFYVLIGKDKLNLADEWMHGLYFVLPPNEEQVERLSAPAQQLSERKKKKLEKHVKAEPPLNLTQVSHVALEQSLLYSEWYQMVTMNFIMMTTIVATLFIPYSSTFYSRLLLLTMSLYFSLKPQFRNSADTELKLTLVVTLLSTLFCFMTTAVLGEIVDIPFENSYDIMFDSLNNYLASSGLKDIRAGLSLLTGLFCSILYLSSRRDMSMHNLMLSSVNPASGVRWKFMSYIGFILPFIFLLLWTHPVIGLLKFYLGVSRALVGVFMSFCMLYTVRQKAQCHLIAPIRWIRSALAMKREFTGQLIQFKLQQTALLLSIVAIEVSTYPLMALWLIWMSCWFTNALLWLVTAARCIITFVMFLQDHVPSLEEVLEEKLGKRAYKKKQKG